MAPLDAASLSAAFVRIGWQKPEGQFIEYLAEQAGGERIALTATLRGKPVGYVTIAWRSGYPPFREAGIPEIQDFNVLPYFQRRGIGTLLLDEAERLAAARCEVVGIGVGLHAGYGAAQRLYVQRGYVPDGRGLAYGAEIVEEGQLVPVNDSLVLHLTKRLVAVQER